MSSTNRGTPRQALDYYATPVNEICKFMAAWQEDIGVLPGSILDPCAGGNTEPRECLVKEGSPHMIFPITPMAYPVAFELGATTYAPGWKPMVVTQDIREDSFAQIKKGFLNTGPLETHLKFEAVISNPPFALAMDFIRHSLKFVEDGGYVAMLLRANFFGSETRHKWFQQNMPEFIYFHSNRMSFTPNGKKDSVEYCSVVWRKGFHPKHSKLRILNY